MPTFVADSEYYTTSKLRNYTIEKRGCKNCGVAALKELKDYTHDISKFIKVLRQKSKIYPYSLDVIIGPGLSNDLILNSNNKSNNVYAHDTYLTIDGDGIRPKIPDLMLNLIPQCYLDVMYPFKRPTASKLTEMMIMTNF
ncbi:hypothetical protein Glove_229g49 [Diversispora epigaea]|uniref:Uncharacterized protein n=1 Tax=Diversispora epigaea TaxID=1348612 RepID=A0A397ID15_9GLOM|nr:hypothetical protein Glove_229g49 [Diversispora epigaea]